MTPPRACPYCGSAVNIRCCEYGREWATEHTEACPVTRYRAELLALETMEPEVQRGAAAEYEAGGDQEVELCTCGAPLAATAAWAEGVCDPPPPGQSTADARWAEAVVDHVTDMELDALNRYERVRTVQGHGVNE